jgi:2-keto-4-pentenoate hydratase/2-oxohepta-3-ene-1,7-dioic acid hydratase in catechol pathway
VRLLNLAGRLVVAAGDRLVDVHDASGGRFSADPQAVYDRWDEFRDWAAELPPAGRYTVDPAAVGAPVPRPRQLFAIGLNYVDHASETGFTVPSEPVVFTKFLSSITGPHGEVVLPPGAVDWEVELVAVIGRTASGVSVDAAWSHIAGVTVGQDLSERVSQMQGGAPQFSLAKSFAGFAPMGPALVTVDELTDPGDLSISCRINGEEVQAARTTDMIFSVPEIVARLSRVVTLLPGDVIFTGTPPGVGFGRSPQRYLSVGDVLESSIEGVGEMRHTFVAGRDSDVPGTGPTVGGLATTSS